MTNVVLVWNGRVDEPAPSKADAVTEAALATSDSQDERDAEDERKMRHGPARAFRNECPAASNRAKSGRPSRPSRGSSGFHVSEAGTCEESPPIPSRRAEQYSM